MSVRQTKPNILTDLSLELLIYRIVLLSPFEILHNQKLAITWRVRLYVYTALLVYAANRVFFCIRMVQINQFLEFFTITGPLWRYVELFDYVFTAVSFAGILTNGLVTSNHQIQFYQELHDFDTQLSADFKISVCRSRTRAINRWVLFANLVYSCGDFYYQYSWLSYSYILAPSLKLTFLFTFYVSDILVFVSAVQFISCTQLCRERLEIVVKLLRSYCSNDPSERLGKILLLYARICSQIVRINKFMGFVVLLKLGHDFTMGTTLLFMMCAYDNGITTTFSISWFVHTLLGTILMTLLSGILIKEINEFAVIVSSLNTAEMSVSSKKVVENFLFLVRHRSPVLNACSVVNLDLQLLFAMGSGMVNYVFVLFQFKPYECEYDCDF